MNSSQRIGQEAGTAVLVLALRPPGKQLHRELKANYPKSALASVRHRQLLTELRVPESPIHELARQRDILAQGIVDRLETTSLFAQQGRRQVVPVTGLWIGLACCRLGAPSELQLILVGRHQPP